MKIVGKMSLIFCLLHPFVVLSQGFPEFNKLKDKADSAYRSKNYPLSANLYEAVFALPGNKRPEILGDFYYNTACVYSLNGNLTKALDYLEKGFAIHNSKKHTNPVSAINIGHDSDLNLIRDLPRFSNLLRKYYSLTELETIRQYSKYTAKEISYSSLLEYIKLQSQTVPYILIDDKIIYWEKHGDSIRYNEEPLPLPNFSGLESKGLVFQNCTFKLNFVWNGQDEHGAIKQEFPYRGLEFIDCKFFGRFAMWHVKIRGDQLRGAENHFRNCVFNKTFVSVITFLSGINGDVSLVNCVFREFALISPDHSTYVFINNSIVSSSMIIWGQTASRLNLLDNRFEQDIDIHFNEIGVALIENNKFKNIDFWSTHVTSEFDFLKNDLRGKLALFGSQLPESLYSDIDWQPLDNFKLALNVLGNSIGRSYKGDGRIEFKPLDSAKFKTGKHESDIGDGKTFRELMGLYSVFLNIYKNKNDIESYNTCFIRVKELQSKRLKYLYETNPTFEKYFRWKLSQLLKFYVRYGTDPARAIVISIYIIIWFGIFFFFFPSDWDITSKKRLIENFKDFVQKNEKGYIKPFFVLLWGFIISLINAVTLSLNAFITLGFGNIPTHGIARYFCVLEGFLGWFLLSIFTVAMINQVL